MEQKIFHDFDFSDFWEDSEYSLTEYVEESPKQLNLSAYQALQV